VHYLWELSRLAYWREIMGKLIVVLILIIIIVVAIFFLTSNSGQPNKQPILQVSLLTLSGKTGDSPTLDFTITNEGRDAKGVIVSVSSPAFSEGSTDKIDILSGKTADVSCKIKVNDVASTDYPVTITYTYDGSSIESVSNPPMFHVVPKLEIVNQHWVWPFLALQEKSHIGQNDNTTLYFTVKSDTSSTSSGLSFQATAPSGTIGLAITPNAKDIDPIGPTGTKEYSLGLKSTNMPPGTYLITLQVFSEAYEAGTLQVTLWVNG
jgi:hypothetical protein